MTVSGQPFAISLSAVSGPSVIRNPLSPQTSAHTNFLANINTLTASSYSSANVGPMTLSNGVASTVVASSDTSPSALMRTTISR